MKKIILFVGIAIFCLTSCDDLFDIHPYSVHFSGEMGINAKQIERIEDITEAKEIVRVAFISDTHGWYKDTKDEIADLNKRTDIDFVVHCGDLTDTGTSKEFKWIRDILSNLQHPYVALIGNHDFLGTGDQSYSVLFGEKNFSFIASRVKFVCLNTNAAEYDHIASVPDFNFMEEAAKKDADDFERTVVIMHAPPYTEQFNNNVLKSFRDYLDAFPGLMCCIYGHNHSDAILEFYNDGLLFYGIASAKHRNYRIMTITPDSYEMEQIYY